MREDFQDARDRYIEAVRQHLEQRARGQRTPGLHWAQEQGWSEARIKRWKEEIQPAVTRRSFLVNK